MFKDQRILVTGGAGFIGSHLVEQLVSNGACVTVIDNLSTGRLSNLTDILSKIQLIVGDLGDLLQNEKINFGEYDYLFHLAANAYIPPSVENPSFDFQINLHVPFLLLEALRRTEKAPRLVNISSAGVYGNPAHLPIRETDPTVPISPYGVSKLTTERYVAVYSRLYGLQATSLRFFSVYGPRHCKQVVYDLLCKLQANPERIQVFGDGTQARDFVHAVDVVQAMLLAATEAPGKGEVYNVALGTTHTISELVSKLSQLCALSPKVIYSGQVRPGDAEKWEVDISCLKGLGFKPSITLEMGLMTVVDWYSRRKARPE